MTEWQRQLNQVRSPAIATDGVFGRITDTVTRDFQRSSGIAADGIVGSQTRAAMARALGGAAPAHAPAPAPSPGGVGTLKRGSRGPEVRALQQRLADLRYWVGPIDGVYGDGTAQAVMAFQKVNGLSRDGVAGPQTQAALRQPRAPQPRSRSGNVVEVDKAAQVLLYVSNGQVQHIFNTSTGSGRPYTSNGRQYVAVTPNGNYTVTRHIDGWRTSHLGQLYRPKYFHGGIAIHGYTSVPAHPASHGCVRVSLPAMDFLWSRLPIGTPIWVY